MLGWRGWNGSGDRHDLGARSQRRDRREPYFELEAATVRSSLTIPAGATSATFRITAGSVGSTTSATITSYQGSSGSGDAERDGIRRGNAG